MLFIREMFPVFECHENDVLLIVTNTIVILQYIPTRSINYHPLHILIIHPQCNYTLTQCNKSEDTVNSIDEIAILLSSVQFPLIKFLPKFIYLIETPVEISCLIQYTYELTF